MILNPFNYHEWKYKIGILLHSKGLYRVSMALENEPTSIVEKAKWYNRLDEAYRLVWPLLLFPFLQTYDTFISISCRISLIGLHL